MSFDFVGAVRARLESGTVVLNAGVNGDLVWNLAKRVDAIVRADPTDVVVLIGTNDLCGAVAPQIAQRQARVKRLPEPASEAFFDQSYRELVLTLRKRTKARLFLISPPLLGEDLKHPAHGRLQSYAHRIESLAHEFGATFIPFHDEMAEALRKSGHSPRPGFHAGVTELLWVGMVPFQRYLFGRSFDAIAQSHGLWGSPDLIHLTERSGGILVDLVIHALSSIGP